MHDIMGKLSSEERLDEGNLVTEASCGSSKAKIFFVSIISFVIALIIVLLVVVIKVDSRFGNAAENTDTPGCIDIAIIGSGLAGSYAAWRLRDENLHISLFEMSSKAGGRIHTATFSELPETFFEFGAPHFNPRIQPNVTKLVENLGLKLIPSQYWENENNTIYHLRGLNINKQQLGSQNIPYNLHWDEKGRNPLDLMRFFMEQIISVHNRSHALNMVTEDNRLLMQQSYITLLRNRASPEAFRFLHDTLERHLMDIDGNAAILGYLVDNLQASLSNNTNTTHVPPFTTAEPFTTVTENITTITNVSDFSRLEGYYTIPEGMDYLPRTLIAHFIGAGVDHRYLTNHFLWKAEAEDGSYLLHFNKTSFEDGILESTKLLKPICARKIIFAIPPEAIEKVQSVGLSNPTVKEMLDAQHRVTSLDVAFVFNQSLFENRTMWTHTPTDLPVTRVSNIRPFQTGTGIGDIRNFTLLHIKSNAKDAEYLLDAAKEEQCIYLEQSCCANYTQNRFIDLILKYVRDIFNMTEIPEPENMFLHQWDPINVGAAWHIWKPFVDWSNVTESIVRPSEQHDIYMVGSAYSAPDKQNNMEGAILSVDNVLDKYFSHELG